MINDLIDYTIENKKSNNFNVNKNVKNEFKKNNIILDKCKYTNNCCKIRSFMIPNNNLCINHYKLKYNNHILNMQKIYRGNKVRRYIYNIYNKLPEDIQLIIKRYINIEHHYYQYCCKINKFIINKSISLHQYKYSSNNLTLDFVIKTFQHYIKYNSILDRNYLKHLYILGNQLLYCFNNIMRVGYSDIVYDIYRKIDLNIHNTEVLLVKIDLLLISIKNYNFIYELLYMNVPYNNVIRNIL
jgi:hypothetical protein